MPGYLDQIRARYSEHSSTNPTLPTIDQRSVKSGSYLEPVKTEEKVCDHIKKPGPSRQSSAVFRVTVDHRCFTVISNSGESLSEFAMAMSRKFGMHRVQAIERIY